MIALCPVWYLTYLALGATAAIFPPLVYQIASAASLLWYRKTGRYESFRTRQIALILVLPAAMHLALGGLAASSGVILWSFLAPVIALLFDERRAGERWFGAFVAQLVLMVVLEESLPLPAAPISSELRLVFFGLNLGAVTTLAFLTFRHYARLLRQEQRALVELSGELARANEHKSRFLRHMSHELRTPLNAILGYAELIDEELTERGDGELAADARRVAEAGRHLLRLIDQVLDLARVESGRIAINPTELEVRELVDEVVTLTRPQVEAKRCSLEYVVAPEVTRMCVDRLRLTQILANLLGNAVKFTDDGGVRLVVQRLVERGRTWVTFAVSDTGIGIAPADMGQLFEESSPKSVETAKVFGGTGLGLALSRHLSRLMEGDISVVSEPGVGSTFTVRLPEAPSDRSDRPEQPERPDRRAMT